MWRWGEGGVSFFERRMAMRISRVSSLDVAVGMGIRTHLDLLEM